MRIEEFSPVDAGVYYGKIRDIRISDCRNNHGKYQEIKYFIFLYIDGETELITPKVFNSNRENCSYKRLEKELKEAFNTNDINVLEHIGLDIAVEIELNYSNGKEYPSIVWYMPRREYDKQVAVESPDEAEYDD